MFLTSRLKSYLWKNIFKFSLTENFSNPLMQLKKKENFRKKWKIVDGQMKCDCGWRERIKVSFTGGSGKLLDLSQSEPVTKSNVLQQNTRWGIKVKTYFCTPSSQLKLWRRPRTWNKKTLIIFKSLNNLNLLLPHFGVILSKPIPIQGNNLLTVYGRRGREVERLLIDGSYRSKLGETNPIYHRRSF